MWSHYADSHKGICIGFDKKSLDTDFNFISWIIYDTKFPEVNLLSDLNESISKIMLHKSNHWEYEQEIRINQFEKKLYPFRRGAIKEVIFGIRTTYAQMYSIMNLMNQCGYRNIEFKKVFLDKEKYEIVFAKAELK